MRWHFVRQFLGFAKKTGSPDARLNPLAKCSRSTPPEGPATPRKFAFSCGDLRYVFGSKRRCPDRRNDPSHTTNLPRPPDLEFQAIRRYRRLGAPNGRSVPTHHPGGGAATRRRQRLPQPLPDLYISIGASVSSCLAVPPELDERAALLSVEFSIHLSHVLMIATAPAQLRQAHPDPRAHRGKQHSDPPEARRPHSAHRARIPTTACTCVYCPRRTHGQPHPRIANRSRRPDPERNEHVRRYCGYRPERHLFSIAGQRAQTLEVSTECSRFASQGALRGTCQDPF